MKHKKMMCGSALLLSLHHISITRTNNDYYSIVGVHVLGGFSVFHRSCNSEMFWWKRKRRNTRTVFLGTVCHIDLRDHRLSHR